MSSARESDLAVVNVHESGITMNKHIDYLRSRVECNGTNLIILNIFSFFIENNGDPLQSHRIPEMTPPVYR